MWRCSSQTDSSPRRCGICSATNRLMVSCWCLSLDNKATRLYSGKNNWFCVWWWVSVIDSDVSRRQGMKGVSTPSTPSGDCPPWTKHTLNWRIHARFHDAFGEDWSSPKWWWFCWGLDPHSRIGRWCFRKGSLDTPIADLEPGVLMRFRRRIDAARLDLGEDILQLEGCLFPRCVHIWWI